MGNRKRFFNKANKSKTLAIQAAHLKRIFPSSRIKFYGGAILDWIGEIQPSPLSEIYVVRIRYKLKTRPNVTIVKPKLQSRGNARIPHVFPGNKLCLFRFKYFEWDATMSIADTIVPWTSLWLHHYEIWLATGIWCGKNEEHPEKDEDKHPTS